MMGWAVGFDSNWGRDIGYGVPAICDFPGCGVEIDRGLGFVCGGEPYGGDMGCGLFFCWENGHLAYAEVSSGSEQMVQQCPACREGKPPFTAKPDIAEWVNWKLTDPSWQQWRDENPEEVEKMRNG
jgi:hypothetical protein